MKVRTVYTTREEWLNAAADEFRPLFEALGHQVPSIRVGVGYPSAGKRSNVIGECWTRSVSGDNHHEIIIRIERTDPAPETGQGILDILLHEITHAVAGLDQGHTGKFREIATGLGLEGPMTATVPSDDLRETFRAWVAYGSLGAYPMGKFGPGNGTYAGKPGPGDDGFKSSAPPKQTTRMLKAHCPDAEYDESVDGVGCGYTVRLTRKWADVAVPTCPNPECERVGRPLALESKGDD